jgi:hypothetical protein
MLKIGVHHSNKRCSAGQHALDAGARQAAPADTPQAAHPRKPPRKCLETLGCAIRRVVVDKNHLEGDALQRPLESAQQFLDVVDLVEGRDHDRQLDQQRIRVGIDHQSIRHH